MTVQLYEGCWGVTQSREKHGPIITVRPEQAVGEVGYIFFRVTGLRTYWTKSGVAAFASDSSGNIIAVFATEAEADAYLAGETDPVAAEIQRDMLAHSDFRAPPATKPVTWPDGVTEMRMADGWKISIVESEKPIFLNDLSFSMTADFARQLAALLLAAADKVEGRG